MIEVQVPKDIRKYEAKLIGPFTLRQLVCFIGACFVAYGGYVSMKTIGLEEHAVPVCMLLCSPFIAFGWVKPYGMNLEKFLQTALITTILAPSERKYKTKNQYRFAAEAKQKGLDSKAKKNNSKLAKKNTIYQAYK